MYMFVNGMYLTDELQCDRCKSKVAKIAITMRNDKKHDVNMNICCLCERELRREIIAHNDALLNFVEKYKKKSNLIEAI